MKAEKTKRYAATANQSSGISLRLSLLYLMMLANEVIQAYAQQTDELLFETSKNSLNSLRFKFTAPQSSAGQGTYSSPLFAALDQAIVTGSCNASLGISHLPDKWQPLKQWQSYPSGKLFIAADNKTDIKALNCILDLINSEHSSQAKTSTQLLIGFAIFFAIAGLGFLGYLTYRHRSSCISKFNLFKNRNEDISSVALLEAQKHPTPH